MLVLVLLSLWATLFSSCYAQKVLVVHDPSISTSDYSSLWDSLRERGLELSFRIPSDNAPATQLYKFNEPQYDQIVMLAPQAKALTSDLSAQSLYKFMSTPPRLPTSLPRNILFGLSSSSSEKWRGFAREFSLEFDEPGTNARDYFIPHNGDPKYLELPFTLEATHQVLIDNDKPIKKPIIYSGAAHTAPDGHPSILNFLHGLPTTISDSPDTSDEPVVYGQDARLVSGFQTSDGARIIWSGSHEIFHNKWWNNKEAGNGEFNNRLVDWAFTGNTIVRVVDVKHERVDGPKKKGEYRKRDYMTYTLSLSTMSGKAPILPLQLEVTMQEPHLRVALPYSVEDSTESIAVYKDTIRLPDQHGIFTLLVDHRDPQSGYTSVNVRHTISITPLRHNEQERFVVGAWPYYVGALSSVIGWVVFVVLWLAGGDKKKKKL